MPEWTDADERYHSSIVHQLRAAGWDKWEAEEEADRLSDKRAKRAEDSARALNQLSR